MNSRKSSAKKSNSKKGSKSKEDIDTFEEEQTFKALYNKTPKKDNNKSAEVEEDVPEDQEVLEDDDDVQNEEIHQDGEDGDEDQEEMDDEIGDDEVGQDEYDEFDEDMGGRPPGVIVGYGQEPNEEDEVKYDEQGGAKKIKIMGLDQNTVEVDMAMVRMKIEDILKVLVRFKELRDPNRTRQSYIDELKENFCTYYGYNSELIELFLNTFSPGECMQFLEANEQPRPSTIRTNTLKTNRKHLAQILMQRGVSLEPLAEWSKVGIKIFESKVPIGATPEYLAGHYMLQSASSFLPVMALAPQINDRVLDVAAAPGGKTTYIAQLMKNTGIVLANDAKAERLKSLKFNLQRLGVTNTIICNYDGRKLPNVMKGFDRVLLDAPCTGLGIIAKDPSIKSSRLYIDVKKMSHLQKELITAAIDCCKPGGYIVYSTCSVTVEENEWVVDYALRNRFVKLVDPGVEIGEEGFIKYMDKRFDPNMKLTRRIYPHIHNMDGFYFAKLQKIKNGNKSQSEEKVEGEAVQKAKGEKKKPAKKASNKKGEKAKTPREGLIKVKNTKETEEVPQEEEKEDEKPVVNEATNDKKKKLKNKKKKQETGKRSAEVELEEDQGEQEVQQQEEPVVPEVKVRKEKGNKKNKEQNQGNKEQAKKKVKKV